MLSMHGGLVTPKCFQLCLVILGGKTTTFTVFAVIYAVVVLARWAGAASCSNYIPLWFFNNGMASVSST